MAARSDLRAEGTLSPRRTHRGGALTRGVISRGFRNRDSLDGAEYEQEPERSAGLQAATDRFGGQFGPVGDPELGEHV
jgi:hypothetical protein